MTVRTVGLEDFTYLVIDEPGWDSKKVDVPDELVLRNAQALAVFNAVQDEVMEYWRAARPESADE